VCYGLERDRARCMRRCHAWRGWSGVSHSR
jgi:hypothetical protein